MYLQAIKNISFFEKILLIVLILFYMNNPIMLMLAKVFVIMAIFRAILLKKNFVKMFIYVIPLAIFIFFYSVMEIYYGKQDLSYVVTLFIYSIVWYCFGYCILNKASTKKMYSWLVSIAIAGVVYVVMCMITQAKFLGQVNPNMRQIVNVWNTTEMINVTNLGGFLVLGIGLIGVLYVKKTNNKLKYVSIGILIISIIYGIYSGHRTTLVILIGTLLLSFILMPNLETKKTKVVIGLVIISVIFLVAYKGNFIGINDAVANSTLFNRSEIGELSQDSRFYAWKQILGDFDKNILGGEKIQIDLNYAHNLWIDSFYIGGIQTLVPLLIFTFIFIKQIYIFVYVKKNNIVLKSIVLSSCISILLYFAVEPVLEGSLILFSASCLFYGFLVASNTNKCMVENKKDGLCAN